MRYIFAALALVASQQVSGPTAAQNYPDRPVTVVGPFRKAGVNG